MGIYHKLLDVCYEECKEQPQPTRPSERMPSFMWLWTLKTGNQLPDTRPGILMIRVLDALTGVKHASGEVKEIKKRYRPVGQQAKNIWDR